MANMYQYHKSQMAQITFIQLCHIPKSPHHQSLRPRLLVNHHCYWYKYPKGPKCNHHLPLPLCLKLVSKAKHHLSYSVKLNACPFFTCVFCVANFLFFFPYLIHLIPPPSPFPIFFFHLLHHLHPPSSSSSFLHHFFFPHHFLVVFFLK